MFNKKIFLSILLIIFVVVFVTAQRNETTAEEDYLSDFFSMYGDTIISEFAESEDYDSKMLALQYIADALDDQTSNSHDIIKIQESLVSLASEGVLTQSRSAGRLTNDYPDVRAEACKLLGKLINSEDAEVKEKAHDTLTKVVLAEKEPWVASAAVKALGETKDKDKIDTAVATIAWVEKKYAALNPTNSLANEILTAYNNLFWNANDKGAIIQSVSKIAVNYYYNSKIRETAKKLLKDFTGRK